MKIQDFTQELVMRYPALADAEKDVARAIEILLDAFRGDRTLFLCGNGGSAADADHIAGEFLKGFLSLRPVPDELRAKLEAQFGDDGRDLGAKLQRGIRAVSLTSHPGFLTAFCNDVDPALIFAQQLYALARSGDVLLGISTSGNAENIRRAFQTARALGVTTILLTGAGCGKCAPLADLVIHAPARETYQVQEYHLPIYHTICMAVEAALFGLDHRHE